MEVACLQKPVGRGAGTGGDDILPSEERCKVAGDRHAQRDGDIAILLHRPQTAEVRFAKLHRLFEHGFEHRRERAGRRIDDLQHLGGGCLLLQR